MITLGIDIGTRFIKAAIVHDGNLIGGSQSAIEGEFRDRYRTTVEDAVASAGTRMKRIQRTFVTGYGAGMAPAVEHVVQIEQGLAAAACRLNADAGAIIDIGSLFIYAVTFDQRGGICDSMMNEKCAAGSGRFLEIIAQAADVPLLSLVEYARKSAAPRPTTSGCAVFAESEVISFLNSGVDRDDVIAGALHSLIGKVQTMMARISIEGPVLLVGGVSGITGFPVFFEQYTGIQAVCPSIDCRLTAAYGAALVAAGYCTGKRCQK